MALRQYERLIDMLQEIVEEIRHYSKPIKEGTLRIMEIDEEMAWAVGRVEYTARDRHEGYYFYSRETLRDGMKARIGTSG